QFVEPGRPGFAVGAAARWDGQTAARGSKNTGDVVGAIVPNSAGLTWNIHRYRLPGTVLVGCAAIDPEIAVTDNFIPVLVGIRYGRVAVVNDRRSRRCKTAKARAHRRP